MLRRLIIVTLLCASLSGCRRPSADVRPVPSYVGLEMRFVEARCFTEAAVGEIVEVRISRGGSLLSPPADSGALVRLVVREASVGDRADPTSRPHVRLVPVAYAAGGTEHSLDAPSPAFEPRIHNPPGTTHLQICVARGGQLVFLAR